MKAEPCLVVAVLACLCGLAHVRVADAQPNIVLIMADDLGYGDLGCYGQELIETPHADRLAAEGLRFTQAYAGSTVCAPSRGVLMTGLNNGHAPVRDNVPHYATYLHDADVTMAEVLQQAGYRCGGIGKWSLGDAGTEGRATNQGFDMFLGYLNQDHAHYYYTEYLDDNEGRMLLPGNSRTHAHYSPDLMTERALEFVEASADGPFFFYGAYTLPHFSAKTEDPTQFAVPDDAPYTDRPWTQKEKNYAAMVARLDRDLGRIVALVDRLGLAERTLVVFTSDNGPWGGAPERFDSNGPLRGVKRDLYEGGIRVPLIARWPGTVPAGRVSHEVIGFWDLLPTFAVLAGVDAPRPIDGVPVVAALQGGRVDRPEGYLYWDYGHCRPRYAQAVRLGDFKGVRCERGGPVELYDLKHDPAEARDLSAQHPQVVRRIEQIMATAATPSPHYPIGETYKGHPIWQKPQSWR